MHAMFFGIKRVHLRVLHITRSLLRDIPLTPARFDMMRIIQLHRDGVPQGNIQYLLGVSAPTVSVMLKSLEKLGFVVRERLSHDGRCLLVQATLLGRQTVREALARLVDSGIANRMAALGLDSDPDIAGPAVELCRSVLSKIRKRYGDPAPFEHPWRIGVLEPYVFHTIVDGRLTYGPPLL